MPALILPRGYDSGLPPSAGSRATWDFVDQNGLDLSGNGYNLTLPSVNNFTICDGRLGLGFNGAAGQVATASTSVLADSDWFSLLAWVWVDPGGSGYVVSRGRDGYGGGWSVTLGVTAGGLVDAFVVIGGSLFQATGVFPVSTGGWNAIGALCLHKAGAEPSFLSAFCNGAMDGRTTLTGKTGLRSSTVGIELGRVNDTLATGLALGRVSIRTLPTSSTELSAIRSLLADYEYEKPAFLRRYRRIYFDLGAGGGVTLTIQDATHGHSADAPVLFSDHGLIVADAAHGHTADNLALSADLALVVADALHSHAADNVTLDTLASLDVQDSTHGHTVDGLTLSAALALVVADAVHGHASDNLGLDTGAVLGVVDAVHTQTADSPALSAALSLMIDEASHGHVVDSVTLTAALSLVIADALHGHTAETIGLTSGGSLAIDDASHGHTAESLGLSRAIALAIHNALHSHAADGLSLTAELTLAIQDALHAHIADNIVWSGQDVLALLRVASVYLRLYEQQPYIRLADPQITLRMKDPQVTLRGH